MTSVIRKRFQKEIREIDAIQPNNTVYLQEDNKREGNIRIAELLLRDIFGEHITIKRSTQGFVCASRDEAGILHLQEYTRKQQSCKQLLLTSLTAKQMQEYLNAHSINETIYVPESPEQAFVDSLVADFPSIRFGL